VLDAAGLDWMNKSYRMIFQPFRIAVLRPFILKIDLLPAKDDRTSSTLLCSVVASVLEAEDTASVLNLMVALQAIQILQKSSIGCLSLQAVHNMVFSWFLLSSP
jgi:hypothetical protein